MGGVRRHKWTKRQISSSLSNSQDWYSEFLYVGKDMHSAPTEYDAAVLYRVQRESINLVCFWDKYQIMGKDRNNKNIAAQSGYTRTKTLGKLSTLPHFFSRSNTQLKSVCIFFLQVELLKVKLHKKISKIFCMFEFKEKSLTTPLFAEIPFKISPV